MSHQKKSGFNFMARKLNFLIVLILIFVSAINVYAQSEDIGDLGWAQPLNLSQSSGSSRPGIVLDSRNVLHVFWEDVYRGYLYRKLVDGVWSEATSTRFPFKVSVSVNLETGEVKSIPPVFIPDKNNRVHAIWVDGRGILYHSYAKDESFGNYGSWLPPQALSESVADMDVEIDSKGDVHLVYVKSSKSVFEKSGIYYRKLVNGGYWENTVLLYESLYLRSINDFASNVDISTATLEDESVKLYVVWDNRALNRIYGINFESGLWGEPFEVEGPNVSSVAVQPINGMVAAKGNQVVYLWQLSQPGEGCIQYYQSSDDAGKSWGERRSMLMELKDCPDQNTFISGQNNPIVLASILNTQIYFSVWNGEEWSRPQSQIELSEYIDPETLNLLALEGPQFVITPENRIHVVGRGVLLDGGADVWVSNRLLGEEKDWFPDGSKWSSFEGIAQIDTAVSAYSILSDNEGWMHVFWANEASVGDDFSGRKIFYARWDGKTWSAPVDILITASGKISPIRAVLDDDQKFILAWADNNSGEIFVSSAERLNALNSREWSKPVSIPSPWPVSTSPAIAIANDGKVFLTFAIPINEFRGIYLTSSEDSGKTWSSPALVYDGAAEGWLSVEDPRIVIKDRDHVFLMFSRRLLPLDEENKMLYFNRSEDGGQNWGEPIAVSDNPVQWGGMVFSENSINRIWLEKNGEIDHYYHDISRDDGKTWSKSNSIQDVIGETFPTDFVIDAAGDVHLIQIRSEGVRKGVLQHWILQGRQWYIAEKYELGIDPRMDINAMSMTLLPDDDLAVVFTAKMMTKTGESLGENLFFTTYLSLDADKEQIEPVESVPDASSEEINQLGDLSETNTVETIETKATPTISFEEDNPVAVSSGMGRVLIGIGIGVLAAALIVFGFLLLSKKPNNL